MKLVAVLLILLPDVGTSHISHVSIPYGMEKIRKMVTVTVNPLQDPRKFSNLFNRH